ncbi:hypothetical protein EST38_g13325 [Candolleomyces aberdarensis]|uniref:NACHT domain-containing protein n=1 Tax=Candolleomyces aberdarensis TaxID=2316362 RepID=A0A4Q2D0Y1_9AGAR|nr:hypothetical protein EST38_g13325 [Candolleomyces aberdarensis]
MAAVVPETAPFVRAAVTANPVFGLWAAQTAVERGPIGSLGGRAFLIVIDGLDECEDKDEIQDFIEGMLAFFDDNPFIPLRVFITNNLVDHCSDDDITTFLDILLESERRRNPVIQAYISEHGAHTKR